MCPTGNWKGLERKAAEVLQGKRLTRGADFSLSIPDVRLPYATHVVVDCKYSSHPFVHHKAFFEDLQRSNKTANMKPKDNVDEHIFYIPRDKRTKILSLIAEAEGKYGKPVVIITREKSKPVIMAAIREEFLQELLMGSSIDEGAFICVMTLEKFRKLLMARYLNSEGEAGKNKEQADDWGDWDE